LHDPIRPSPNAQAERDARRVRLWCERKDAMWAAIQAENVKDARSGEATPTIVGDLPTPPLTLTPSADRNFAQVAS
jgi:hypothetical protein